MGFAYYVSSHPMDYRVYFYGARGVFDGTRPVYGVNSGLGWPMHYRYPPLFLLLFAPLAMLPLGLGAAIWIIVKIAVLGLFLKTMYRHIGPPLRVLPFLFIAPYLIEDFRYGNAQFFIFALAAAALLLIDEQPVVSAATLALGISIKVWPLFFLPYVAARRNWKVLRYTVVFVMLLSMLPGLYFGFGSNFKLLGQWFSQESHTQLSEAEIWFPNQSLRGVLMRYLTVIDYSLVPDSNYAHVNIAAWEPAVVRLIWIAIAAVTYAGFLWLANQRRFEPDWAGKALAFCLIAILEPFTQKYALAILLWPAVILASGEWKPKYSVLLYSATILALLQPLIPGANAQRLLQVLGLDFVAAVLITITFAAACLEFSTWPVRTCRRNA